MDMTTNMFFFLNLFLTLTKFCVGDCKLRLICSWNSFFLFTFRASYSFDPFLFTFSACPVKLLNLVMSHSSGMEIDPDTLMIKWRNMWKFQVIVESHSTSSQR